MLRRGGRRYLELERERDALRIEVKQGPDWTVYVNGDVIGPNVSTRVLKELDIVVIEERRRDRRGGRPRLQRDNFVYLSNLPPVMAYVRWRNGESRRVYPAGREFPLVYALGKAADRVGDRMEPDLPLSLNLRLHRQLQRETERWAASQPDYAGNLPLKSKKLAVTVMDAFSGEVLALPSYPSADPSTRSFERELRNAVGQEERDLASNHNFGKHVVGSTLKPLTFSALAVKFWPRDISRLTVIHAPPHRQSGGIPFGRSYLFKGPPKGDMMDMGNFLIHSYDWPQVVLGFFGMLLDPAHWDFVCVPAPRRRDVEYAGRPYTLNLRRVPDPKSNSPFAFDFGRPSVSLRPGQLDNALLFLGLRDIFGAGISQDSRVMRYEACKTFLPSFGSHYPTHGRGFDDNGRLADALPDPVSLPARDAQTVAGSLVSLFLGAGEGRWTNVSMAQAAARIATGRQVVATLQPKTGPQKYSSPSLPMPLSDTKWRNENLLEPLKQVGLVGTAASLRTMKLQGYTAIYKTGTIEERDEKIDSETLMFVIGRFVDGQFLPGETVAGYLYMQDSNVGGFRKFSFAQRILPLVVRHLQDRKKAVVGDK